VKVAHHFSGGASVVLRVRPGGTIGHEFWSYRVRSIVQRFTSDALPRIRGQGSNISIVPPGRIPFETAPPALKCWATFIRSLRDDDAP
jgi:hypothetical protein